MGTEGNERADDLAKTATTLNIPVKEIPFSTSIIKSYFKKKILLDWQHSWTHSNKGRDTYDILNKINPDFIAPSIVIPNYLSGHGSFPTFLYKIKKRPTKLCLCGKDIGSVTHYIFGKCPLLSHHFHFNKEKTLRQNLQKIILSTSNFTKLRDNYNILNKHYSFIKKDL